MNALKILFIVIGIFLIFLLSITPFINKKNQMHEYKGIAMTLFDTANNDNWYDQTFPKIRNVSNQLEVVTAATIQNNTDSNPINDPGMPSKMDRLFQKCKQYGLNVSLIKPHIMLPNYNDGFDRGNYKPENMDVFFKQWKKILLYYASVCDQNQVPILSLSCESTNLTDAIYMPYWREIINEIRGKYPNLKLTMALRHGEIIRELSYHESNVESVSTLLDYISLNIYPSISRKDEYSLLHDYWFRLTNNNPNLYASWDHTGYLNIIRKTREYFGKKILVTETGCSARSDSTNDSIHPILLDAQKPKDHMDQNQWMNTILRSILLEKDVEGVFIWHINAPFNFLDSPTEQTIKKLFTQIP